MRKNLLRNLLLLLCLAPSGVTKAAGPSPAYWSGTFTKLLSSGGLDPTAITGQGIKGVIDASNATAGNVGEFSIGTPRSTDNASITTTSGTYADTGATTTLTAGDWDVLASCTIQITDAVSGSITAQLAITDNTPTVIVEQYGGTATIGTQNVFFNLPARLNISATTTYRIRAGFFSFSGSPTTPTASVIASSTRLCYIRSRRVR